MQPKWLNKGNEGVEIEIQVDSKHNGFSMKAIRSAIQKATFAFITTIKLNPENNKARELLDNCMSQF